MDGLSNSDVALLADRNDGMFSGGNVFFWVFALLLLNNGGFGGWGGANSGLVSQADELSHADNLYKMFEQYYTTIAKAYGAGKVPEYIDDMKNKITEMYMTKSAKVKYMHDTYKK